MGEVSITPCRARSIWHVDIKLSSYDASYLELALRQGVALATLDADLRKAAKKAGVEILRA